MMGRARRRAWTKLSSGAHHHLRDLMFPLNAARDGVVLLMEKRAEAEARDVIRARAFAEDRDVYAVAGGILRGTENLF